MALTPDLAAGIVDAVAVDTARHNNNSYTDKIVHADIRVLGIDNVASQEGAASHVEPVLLSESSKSDSSYSEDAQRMQSQWEESIAKHRKAPEGYVNVAVLLIKWEDEIDDMKTGKEANELDTLFRERFRYTTKIVELGVNKPPQQQLDMVVSQFIFDHDGPDNLLIIYYTGHGRYLEEKKFLEITGSQDPERGMGFRKDAVANWNKVEDKLQDEGVACDVLEILDTCYSSNLVKSSRAGSRKFELLSACFIDQTTASPGNYSFTRSLIDTLKGMLNEFANHPFSTFSINERIVKDRRRFDTQSHLWARIHSVHLSGQHILLTPMPAPLAAPAQQAVVRRSPKAYLTLRFGMKETTLLQEQIDSMTKFLTKVVIRAGLQRVDWVDVRLAPPVSLTPIQRVALVMVVKNKWKQFVVMKKAKREEEEEEAKRKEEAKADAQVQIASPQSIDVDLRDSSQKRSREDGEDLPVMKRRHTEETSQAPSPPISNSSYVD